MLAAASGSWAAPSASAQKEELKQLRARIVGMQKQLAASEETKNEAADALAGSERAISEANRRLRELAAQQRELDAQLAQLRRDYDHTATNVAAQQSILARLIYQRYRGAQPDALKLLLNEEHPDRVARELQYLGYLARSHAELIANLRSNLERLAGYRQATEEQRVALAAVNAEQQKQRQRLESEKRARRSVLTRVSKQIDQQRREIATLKRNENRLSKLVDQLVRMLARAAPRAAPPPTQRSAPRSAPRTLRNEKLPEGDIAGSLFDALKGRLRLPVRGELRNRFGTPREDSGLSWKGLFIAAPAGEAVRSIAAGRVVFADWLRGFGNLLIIDHGQGYMSLYGNNEALYKQVGDATTVGETVATVGNSGGNPDSGLYFEIRHQGKPTDPLGWVSLK